MAEFNVEFVGGPLDGQLRAMEEPTHTIVIPILSDGVRHDGRYVPEKTITDGFPIPHRFIWCEPTRFPGEGA